MLNGDLLPVRNCGNTDVMQGKRFTCNRCFTLQFTKIEIGSVGMVDHEGVHVKQTSSVKSSLDNIKRHCHRLDQYESS